MAVCFILEAGFDNFLIQVGIISENLFFAPTLSEQARDEFNRVASPSDDGLTDVDTRVNNNSLLPVHSEFLCQGVFYQELEGGVGE